MPGPPAGWAVPYASECPPTFNTDPERVVGLIAGGPAAMVTSVEGAEDSEELARRDLDALKLTPDDTVVGVSASGRTPYAVGAVEHARALGALTIGLAGNEGSALAAAAEHGIEVVTGPELITGSTRLKAGTAQKLVLNMLSTITMIRLGKTYGNRRSTCAPPTTSSGPAPTGSSPWPRARATRTSRRPSPRPAAR
ncbi:N-acetylmuramic acid 6-phosphate etherase [Streptomyces canarius]